MNIKSLSVGVLISFSLLPCHAAFVGIHAAAATGDQEQLKKYLADDPGLISARNGPNRTPLCIAAMRGQTNAVEFLISHGADVNDKGFQEMTPLADMASPWGLQNDQRSAEIAEILIAHGAKIDPVDAYQNTPLLWAVESRKSRLAHLLLEHGASQVSRYTGANSGMTPLHMAIRHADKETIAVLLKFKPPLDAVDRDAQSPLMLADILDRTEIAAMIRQAAHDTNVIPSRAEMRTVGKRVADGEMTLKDLANITLDLNRTISADRNLRAYVPSPRGQLIRDRIGNAFLGIGDEAMSGNAMALQVLKQCVDPKNPINGFRTYALEAFSRLAAAGNKAALDVVLHYDTQGTMNTFLYAPAAANIEPAVDYFVNWLSTVKPYERQGGLVMEATNSLASAAAKGNEKAKEALEKYATPSAQLNN